METTVIEVIDGDTFRASPGWKWEDENGDRVRPTGYNAPESGPEAVAATRKLSTLILNKKVELGTAHRVDRGRLVCDVYFQGKNLADYFPEYKV